MKSIGGATLRNEEEEITDEELKIPIAKLVNPDEKRVKIRDMAEYWEIFFAIENTTLFYWESHPDITDEDVIRAFIRLLRDFDNQKEGTLASEISKGIKAILILRKKGHERDYTLGEIYSCIALLKKIARNHESSDGTGYLKWIRTFFEGRMPETEEEVIEYILKNEM